MKDGFRIHGAYGDWCTRALAENNTARYANTVAVANDMLRYIETKARREGTSPEEAKLWFYGISYGTILGATYATLFPNRIARMILDGVLDTEEYYTNGWSTSVSDFDASIRQFFKLCFEAGPELCAFHKNASSPEELENRLLAIFDALRENPIEVVDRSLISPVTVTWADLVNAISISINNPIVLGPTLAQALSDLEDRNATIIAMNDAQASLLIPNEYDMRETRGQTSCLDNNGRFNTSTIDEYTAHFGLLYDQSKYGGPVLGSIVGSVCRNLNIFPPESQVFPGEPYTFADGRENSHDSIN